MIQYTEYFRIAYSAPLARRNPDDKEGAEKKFQAIAAAYTFLKPFAKQSVVDNMERLEAELAENPQDAVKQVGRAGGGTGLLVLPCFRGSLVVCSGVF